ncbi:MAG: helix-turn-helix transcriptional regulator [Clostridia bacterium]|nr:helix-turn-helix transcriptional regulator [Clostridia bacterium]
MFRACVTFSALPQIGFAHHFYMEENYWQKYGKGDHSFELVYINGGGITGELYGKRFIAQPGSLLVLFRHLPIRLYSTDGLPQSHCSVQLIPGEYAFTLLGQDALPPEDFAGILLPFVLPPCEECESIRKELFAIVSDLGADRKGNALSASLRAMGVLAKVNALCRSSLYSDPGGSPLDYRIKRYIIRHLGQKITLQDIAGRLGKSPNYLNSIFKKNNGISIHQYINREKVRLMAELMENKGLSFRDACLNVGVEEITYGYRLFKKHMGLSPGEYLRGLHRVDR